MGSNPTSEIATIFGKAPSLAKTLIRLKFTALPRQPAIPDTPTPEGSGCYPNLTFKAIKKRFFLINNMPTHQGCA